MKVSLNWLQNYFDEKLPEAEKIAELLNFHSFEVESLDKLGTGDVVMDVKILPDRACYTLSHRGIAGEIAAAGNFQFSIFKFQSPTEKINKRPEINIVSKLCSRYIGRRVENVKIEQSPEWLKKSLEAIGERSINNIVDAANYVMFDIGQPLHAFDADKVKGTIQVRLAKKDEKMTTLDGQDITLDGSMLIIADEEGPLAIAGIKGGKRAEVGPETKNLILEAANFDPSSVRMTSTKLDLKTGAARRFEAKLSPELASDAMNELSEKISQVSPGAVFGPINDVYVNKPKQIKIPISAGFISQVLGVNLGEQEIIDILSKISIKADKKAKWLDVLPPAIRTDLRIPEDIVEEVGRIYGYEKIVPKLPPAIRGQASVQKDFYYVEKIKNILTEQGFSEVSLYTFVSKGQLEVAKPLADDKRFLRENLAEGVAECLSRNAKNSALLGLNEIRIFEIGSVFTKAGEKHHVCIGRQTIVKKDRNNDQILEEIINLLSTAFEKPLSAKIMTSPSGSMAEIDITDLFLHAKYPGSYQELGFGKAAEHKFKQFSQYPFVLRDIAVFTPKGTDKEQPLAIINKESGEWLQKTDLFDTFEKGGKVSYAFHLVFQSFDKTLTDSEVNEVMERVTKNINSQSGWQVR